MKQRDIAVVGMACLFPDANGIDTYWRNIVAGKDSIREVPRERWPGSRLLDLPPEHQGHVATSRGGFISSPYLFDPIRHKVMPNVARHGDVDQFILLDVIADALADAGISEDHPSRKSTDVILGRGNYTSNKMLEVFLRSDGCDRILSFLQQRLPQLSGADLDALEADLRASLPPLDPDAMATAITNLTASRAANRLDLGGAAFVVDAACASSLLAMEIGVERLREGKTDAVVACGINFTNVPGFWYLFGQLGAFSPTGQIRPFDSRADGILIGEGAGAVVLKRAEDAQRDGDRAYAVIKGLGSSSDGKAAGILAPSSEGQVRALRQAYEDAGLYPEQIGLLEAHGTGTAAGDRVEIETIREVFGPPVNGVPTRVMGSVKSMIGHTLPASGMASFIKCALALTGKILPPSLHCDEPDPALNDLAFFVSPVARPWLHNPKRGPRRAAVNAFGFGGVNAHVILEEVREPKHSTQVSVPEPALLPRPVRPGLRPPTELLAFTGSDVPALAARLREVAVFVEQEGGPFELEDLAYTLALEAEPDAHCRLGIIRPSLDGLAADLEDLAQRTEQHELKNSEALGLFHGEGEVDPEAKIAAVFPGIAFPGLTGEFPDHLLSNCMHFPVAREAFDLVEDRDEHPGDTLPTSLLLVPPGHLSEEERTRLRARFAAAGAVPEGELAETAADDRNLAQMGTLVNNWANWQVLCSLGVPVDMLCGQSLGDLSAVLSAGMVDFEDSVSHFWKTFNLEVPYVGSGSILMVGTTEEELTPHLDEVPDADIAIHLSPSVLVVGGSDTAIKTLNARLREHGILSQGLPFPPIHTPRLTEYQTALTEAIGFTKALRPAEITVYSAVVAAPMPEDPEEVAELLRTNISRPIRFWQTLHRMVDDGARFIVQIGSGTLAAGSRTILERDDIVCVAMDVGERHPVTQVQTLCGQLFSNGLRLDLEKLFSSRTPQRLELANPAAASAPSKTAFPLTLYWPPLYDENAPKNKNEPKRERPVTAPPAGQPSAPATDLPFLGNVEQYEPGRRIVTLKRLELEEHLYLKDHVFLNITDVKPLRDCSAVVPLTFILEMLAETAACLAPGLGLVGLEQMRATRWIGFDGVDSVDVRVEGELREADGETISVSASASVDGEKVASAVVNFAPRYRQTLEFAFQEQTNVRPFSMTAREVYDGRHFFHGPRFQCIDKLHLLSDQGTSGELVVPPRNDLFRSIPNPQLLLDPVVLDGAGQMLGAFFLDSNVNPLPVSVSAIEFYQPAPPPGTRLPVQIELTEIDLEGRRIQANFEVQDGRGQVWFRVVGWQDILFLCSPNWSESMRTPRERTLSTPLKIDGLGQEAVVTQITRDDIRHVPPDWLARSFLASAEEGSVPWKPGEDLKPWTSWLLGRAAAKDAARLRQSQREGAGRMTHPIRIVVVNDESGQPSVELVDGESPAPAISLAHTDAGAVAVAAEHPVGIDVEPLDAGARLVLEDFSTEGERELLQYLPGSLNDPSRITRLWCAKEAASKALGTGLQGRPKIFEAVEADGTGRLMIRHASSGRQVEVRTVVQGDLLIAVATTNKPHGTGSTA